MHQVTQLLDSVDTLDEVEMLIGFPLAYPEEARQLEQIGYALMTPSTEYRMDHHLRRAGRHLLVALTSRRFHEAFYGIVGPDEYNIYFREETLQDLDVLATPEDLPMLIQAEMRFRAEMVGIPDRHGITVSAIAKAMGLIGTRAAFDALVDVLRNHERLDPDAVSQR